MKRYVLAQIVVVALVAPALLCAAQLDFDISAKNYDCTDVPVCGEVALPTLFGNVEPAKLTVMIVPQGKSQPMLPGQIVRGGNGKSMLCFVVPEIRSGQKTSWTATIDRGIASNQPGYSWSDKKNEYLDLLFDGRKVTRYMYAHDTSTPDRLHQTYKVFHHVFDQTGDHLLTKGPDGEHPYEQGLYTHHRGIFIGWNKLKYGSKQGDFWHMKGVFLTNQGFADMSAGPVLASSTAKINWVDGAGHLVIDESRTTTVFHQSDPTILLLEFQTTLKAVNDDVLLDGDPEHAGFQYRPHNDVASGGKDVKALYLFHKDGVDAHKDQNLPWVGLYYGLNDKRYSVLHMSHPDNPSPSVYSAYRDYGRFGQFFKTDIRKGDTLGLKYRILVRTGTLPQRQDFQDKYLSFVDPPQLDNVRWKP